MRSFRSKSNKKMEKSKTAGEGKITEYITQK